MIVLREKSILVSGSFVIKLKGVTAYDGKRRVFVKTSNDRGTEKTYLEKIESGGSVSKFVDDWLPEAVFKQITVFQNMPFEELWSLIEE